MNRLKLGDIGRNMSRIPFSCAFLILAVPGFAQSPTPEAELGKADPVPAFHVNVDVDLQQVSAMAQQVLVRCTVYTEQQWQAASSKSSGSGTISVFNKEIFGDMVQSGTPLMGNGVFKGKLRVPIFAEPPYDPDFWTRGRCALLVVPSNANRHRDAYPVRACGVRDAQLSIPNIAPSCAWPQTDPKNATVEFVRPGLGIEDSAVDEADGR